MLTEKQKKPEKAGKRRNLQGTVWGKIMIIFAVSMSVFQFIIAGTGGMTPLLLRAIHLAFACTLIFLIFPGSQKAPRDRITVFDAIGIVAAWAICVYLFMSFDQLAFRAGAPNTPDIVLGIITCILVLEITRRTTGWLLTSIGLGVLVYAYLGPYLPGLLAHRGFSISKIATYMYTGTDGIFGLTLGVSATYIFFFILFGSFLESMRAGQWFIELAYGLTGRRKGGPAQTVVLANTLMSTISGVPAADVVTIGAFTFPLLNRLGYNKYFSAALSAAASTGAMIMPPVMGSAAFLMVEVTGIPYQEIIKAALIPAILFYVSLFAVTHFYASKHNMVGAKAEDLPKVRNLIKSGWFYLVPIFVLLYLLIIRDLSPMLSGYYSIWSLLAVVVTTIIVGGASSEKFREFGMDIFKALRGAALNALPLVATCACAGFLVGVLNLTGLGLRFSSIMIAWSQGNLFFALVLTAGASIILGMGLPIAACYMVLAILIAPALVQMGIPVMSAHLFILFFGSFSAITPPVAISAYAAGGMMKVDPIKVAVQACWLSLTAFAIPFMFVYGPPLLMEGNFIQVIWAFVTAFIGVIAMASGIMGWLIAGSNFIQRIMMLAGALSLINPGIYTDAIGFVLIGLVIIWQRNQIKNTPVSESVHA